MWTLTVVIVQPMPNREDMRVRLEGEKPDGGHVCTIHTRDGQLGWWIGHLEKLSGECELVLPRG